MTSGLRARRSFADHMNIPENPEDGEILGIDTDGCLIQWNADQRSICNCGETPEQFGIDNILPHEIKRIMAHSRN